MAHSELKLGQKTGIEDLLGNFTFHQGLAGQNAIRTNDEMDIRN